MAATRPSVMRTPRSSFRIGSNFSVSCIAIAGGDRIDRRFQIYASPPLSVLLRLVRKRPLLGLFMARPSALSFFRTYPHRKLAHRCSFHGVAEAVFSLKFLTWPYISRQATSSV